MKKTSSCIGLVFASSLFVACGSNSGSSVSDSGSSVESTAATCTSPNDLSCRIAVDAPSVVRWVAPATDGVSTGVIERTSDKTCMSGKIDPGPNDTGWGAILVFELAPDDQSKILAPFDIPARGVTQVRFNLSNPPPTGIQPQLVELTSADCTTAPDCLDQFGGSPTLTSAGSVTVALGDLVVADAQQANTVSDPALSVALQFYVSSSPGMSFDYDFCIQNLQFLDAGGNEISR